MGDIENKILKLAKETANKKIKEEKEIIEKRLNNEIDDVKFILELINKKMLYKRKGESYNPKGYELITEDIFLQDYFEKEPKNSWSNRLQIKDRETWDSEYYEIKIEVNGERYFHIGCIINDFEKELKNKKERIKRINRDLWEIEKDFNDFKKQESIIKQMIEDYHSTEKTLNSKSI